MANTLVVIGGSSGGLEAMLAILHQLPATYRVPTILVLHQKANRISGVPQMLRSHTHLSVIEPDDKQLIEAGCLYVAPPNYHLLVEKEKILSLSSDAPVNYCRPAIDVTLEAAADVYGKDLVVCILSGANHDGAQGCVCVKQKGGRVLVQCADEASVSVMPDAAAKAVAVDGLMTLQEMAAQLASLSVAEIDK